MKVKTVSYSDAEADVLFSGTSHQFMNALRRAITNEVPVLAIEDIEFRKQGSALYDEMLAHRLGLLPIVTPYDSYDYEEVEDENARSARSMVTLTLQAKGPGVVHADQIESRDPAAKPAQPGMPLAKLLEDQEIEFEARAIMGKGKRHAKFVPGIVAYREDVKIDVKNAKPEKSVREQFPKELFDGTELKADRITTPELIDAVDGIDDSVVTVTRSETDFVLHVESFGQLSARDMVTRGVTELQNMLAQLEQEVKANL